MSILRHSQSVSLAHRYWNNQWSHERNRAVYGSLSSPEGVGSNLRVESEVAVSADFDFAPVAAWIKSRLDHRSLMEDIGEFAFAPCTLESVATYLAREAFAQNFTGVQHWRSLTLWELDRYAVRVEPGQSTVDFLLYFRNLLLSFRAPIDPESRLAVSRVRVEQVLGEIFACFSRGGNETEFIWLERLFGSIRERLPAVNGLTVDLGSHKLTTQSSPLDNAPSGISGL